MCGFAAIIAFYDNAPELERIERMSSELIHRGPDDQGVFRSSRAVLAFRRLSILDVSSAGHQPMLSPDGRFAMVFNGEIYNYIELRSELENEGWKFRSTGDSEVLLAAYIIWGENCLKRLNGMYSFIIFDTHSENTFIARDRSGIKPLYYVRTKDAIFIASEPKALVVGTGSTLDIQKLAQYLQIGRTDSMEATARTYFNGIYALEAANVMTIARDGTIRRFRHWEVPSPCSKLAVSNDRDLVEQYRDIFRKAVTRQMRSDVPVGITLSGGVDSSSVACVAQTYLKPNFSHQLTYFCFHTPKFDESKFRNEVTAKSGGRTVLIEGLSQSIVEFNQRLVEMHDEPLHSITALANAELYRAAKAEGIKVLLGGQGADEILAGYPVYRNVMLREIAIKDGWWSAVKEMKGRGWVEEGRRADRIFELSKQLSVRKLRQLRLVAPRIQNNIPFINRKGQEWLTSHASSQVLGVPKTFEEWDLWGTLKDSYQRMPLPDYLRIEDRNSMTFGVEARVPFLDYDLVDFAFSLPANSKIRGGITKYIHRAAMRGVVPDALLDRPEKYGFPVDESILFTPAVIDECLDVIASGPLLRLGLIDFNVLKEWVSIAPTAQGIRALFTTLQATLVANHADALQKRSEASVETFLGEIPLG